MLSFGGPLFYDFERAKPAASDRDPEGGVRHPRRKNFAGKEHKE